MDRSQVSFVFVPSLRCRSLGGCLFLCPVPSYVEANMYELVTSLFSLLPLSQVSAVLVLPFRWDRHGGFYSWEIPTR